MRILFFAREQNKTLIAYRVPKGTLRVGCHYQPANELAGYPYLMPKGITPKNELYIYATALSTHSFVAS